MDETIVDKKISEIIELLRKEKPDVGIALTHSTPLELLIATILSAQCTDRRVNEVTKKLFKNTGRRMIILQLLRKNWRRKYTQLVSTGTRQRT